MTNRWHERFLAMADLVASWSKDPSTKIGAVIVRPDRTVASVGYNGFPRRCDDSAELYEDRALKYQRVVHAELNAILSAREPLHGYAMYVSMPTCGPCAGAIIQAGIRVVIHREPTVELRARWGESFVISEQMFSEANVLIIRNQDDILNSLSIAPLRSSETC